MRYRILFDDKKVAEAPQSVKMTIDSKCPKKWAFVDMETGDIWVSKHRFPKRKNSEYDFYAADDTALSIIKNIMRGYTEL